MKNLRKVLALVLVVATLFSFASVAGAYTDDAAISADYSQAVGVLSKLGILNGYEDGSFKPAATIDRDEMAKMIAVLANAGDDQVHTVYEGACNFADTKTNWAKSYIGYCAHTGIVAGRSETTFDPNGKVTGLETAKMLLVVLGFNAEKQGYVGSNWKVNVIRDAKNFGLLDNFAADFDATKAITREQAAQMFLNALMTNIVVGTLSENIIDISNASYVGLMGKEWTLIDAEKYGITLVYGNVLLSNTLLLEAFKCVVNVQNTVDCHGRPTITWTYIDAKGNRSTQTFLKSNLLAKTYTKKATTAADFKAYNTGKYTVAVFHNSATPVANTFAAADALTGNGTVTEVYVDEMLNVIYVVVIDTFIGRVANVSARYGTYDLVDDLGTVQANLKNTAGFSNGTIVLYWLCTNGETLCLHDHAVTAAPSITGKVTYSALGNGVDMFKLDGKDQAYANTFGQWLASDKIDADDTKSTKVVYTDLNGYVMYITNPAAASTPTNVAYFPYCTWTHKLPTVETCPGVTDEAWYTDIVGFDAVTTEDVQVQQNIVAAINARQAEYGTGSLIKYTDGAVKGFVEYGKFAVADSLLSSTTGEITRNELYGNDATKYLVNTPQGYKSYVGYKSLDKDYLAKQFLKADENGEVQQYVYIQYFDANNDKIAEYVYIDATYTTTNTMFYVLGDLYAASWDEIWGITKAYDVYKVLVDGKEAVLAVAEGYEVLENGLYEAKLTLLAADAAMLVDGTKVPMYVAVDFIPGKIDPADYPFFPTDEDLTDEEILEALYQFIVLTEGYAVSEHNGLLKIVNYEASDSYSYLNVADDLVVIDITYGEKFNFETYKGYEVLDHIRSAEWDAFYTWIFFNEAGEVCLIYREIV